MPSFFGYLLYSVVILFPVFIQVRPFDLQNSARRSFDAEGSIFCFGRLTMCPEVFRSSQPRLDQ